MTITPPTAVPPVDSSTESPLRRFETLVRITVALMLALGCWLVLQPFFSAILFAVVIAVSTWPVYRWLQRRLGNRDTLSAALACMIVMLITVGPAMLIGASVGDAVSWLLGIYDNWTHGGMPQAPDWLRNIPFVGAWLQDYWAQIASGKARTPELANYFAEQIRSLVLNSGRAVGNGLLQTVLSVIVLFFLYQNGRRLGARIATLAGRIGGNLAPQLLSTAQTTVVSVMVGILGTALAQAMVAVLGFSIAGVPNPLLLGAATFVLSMVPVGPPLIWGGAALWLFQAGEHGWAVFMAVYGVFCISSVDNIIKPFLISRGAHLPFVVTLLGVFGGLIAFGLIGLFLGPTLLALAINLTVHWLALIHPEEKTP